MTVYILWMIVHCVEQEGLVNIYKNKEDCIEALKRLQDTVSTDIFEYHMQEYKLR